MKRTLRVAALQLRAHDRAAFTDRRLSILTAIEKAAADADLLILPEATVPAYVLGDDAIDESAVAAMLHDVRALAADAKTVIVLGTVERERDGLRNRAVVIDRDGSIAGHADKLFLWHFDRKWFQAGDRIAPIHTSIGRIGVLVCADGRMPAIARTLVDRGAECLVMPTAWVTSGRDVGALENIQADLLVQVRAFENNVPFVAANKCGIERGMVAYCGKSQIVDANGNVVSVASEQREEAISATIELAASHPHRAAQPVPATSRERLPRRSSRVAITMDTPTDDVAARLQLLDAEYLIAPHLGDFNVDLERLVPSIVLDDETPLDPGVLIEPRLAGTRLLIWRVSQSSPWIQRVARARALELRIYVVVLDRETDRAYAIDPDGAIVAGTFGDYRLATFVLDPERTEQTSVAPATDIAIGLERIAALIQASPR